MAVVRLSDTLKDNIRNAVRDSYGKQRRIVAEEQRKANPPPFTMHQIYDMAMSPFAKELSPLSDSTRRVFLGSVDRVIPRLAICPGRDSNGDLRDNSAVAHCSDVGQVLGEHFGTPVVWPCKDVVTKGTMEGVEIRMNSGYMRLLTISVDAEHSIPDTRKDTDMGKLRQWALDFTGYDEIAELNRQEKEAIEKCNQMLSSYSTLAPLLKVWPTLWELLPNETKERHKRPSTRKAREDIERSLPDMTSVSSIIIANKIQGNSNDS